MTPYLARQSPLAVHMFRHTRATLRAYHERGLRPGPSVREPIDAAAEFQTDAERDLYDRIDPLCWRVLPPGRPTADMSGAKSAS